jgi:MinD superfamily P-loop ATPase
MIISVLSGKGGTGKTTVATNLAYAAEGAAYVDCDVEEPNGFIFLKPEISIKEKVNVMVPSVAEDICSSLWNVQRRLSVQCPGRGKRKGRHFPQTLP